MESSWSGCFWVLTGKRIVTGIVAMKVELYLKAPTSIAAGCEFHMDIHSLIVTQTALILGAFDSLSLEKVEATPFFEVIHNVEHHSLRIETLGFKESAPVRVD
jgi:hypothetical protein